MYVDTHSHLNFREFKDDLARVIKRAKVAGVTKIIVVGSDINNSKKSINLAQKYNNLFATVGIHPTHIKGGWGLITRDGMLPSILVEDYDTENGQSKTIPLSYLKRLLNNPRAVALGEIGLDFYQDENRPKYNKDAQMTALTALVRIGQESGKPIIFHCRNAMNEFIYILKKFKRDLKGVLHCFPGGIEEAKILLERGLYISFTGLITFVSDFDKVIKFVPLDRIMIETDCPYLTPKPHRGKRNEPAYVVEVARRIAEIKKIPLPKVAEATTDNALSLFNLD